MSALKYQLGSYLKQDKRISKNLQRLTKILQKQSKKGSTKQLRKYTKDTKNPIKIFKILILIHQCYLKNTLEYASTIDLIGQLHNDSNAVYIDYLKSYLAKQVINDYKLYLQKCYQCKIMELQRVQQMGIIGRQRKSIFQQFQATQSSKQQIIEQIYIKTNLLTKGLQFITILFTFGRYYRNSYQFITDFNIIMGKDIRNIYVQLKQLIDKNRQLLTEVLKEEIQRIHEKMYILYYNTYFHKEVRCYIPDFIETDELADDGLYNQYLEEIQDVRMQREKEIQRRSFSTVLEELNSTIEKHRQISEEYVQNSSQQVQSQNQSIDEQKKAQIINIQHLMKSLSKQNSNSNQKSEQLQKLGSIYNTVSNRENSNGRPQQQDSIFKKICVNKSGSPNGIQNQIPILKQILRNHINETDKQRTDKQLTKNTKEHSTAQLTINKSKQQKQNISDSNYAKPNLQKPDVLNIASNKSTKHKSRAIPHVSQFQQFVHEDMDLDDSNKGNVTNTIEDEENSQTGLLINYNQIHIPKQYDQFGKHMLRKQKTYKQQEEEQNNGRQVDGLRTENKVNLGAEFDTLQLIH